MKKRVIYLDVIRIVACLFVIAMHAPMPAKNAVGPFNVGLSYLTMPCIGMFFAVSGALLLPITHKNGDIEWLRHRLTKVIIPMLIWTFIYMLFNGSFTSDFVVMLKKIFSIPFSAQGHGVLWFIYTLVGLYFLTPVISPWIEKSSEKTISFYLLLWLITTCYPLLSLLIKVNRSVTGSLYYMSGYAGYFLFGYWLHHYGERLKLLWLTLLMALVFPLPAVFKLLHYEVDFHDVFWYLGIFGPIMVAFWWVLLRRLSTVFVSDRIKYAIVLISNLSFGIYLCHILIMRHGIWKLMAYVDNYYLQTMGTILVTFIASLVLSFLLALTPIGKYTIGYSISRRK